MPTGKVTDHAMVVAAREEAAAIGAEVMRKGGNAFDAMVATELALAVAHPTAGNIGGGGFLVYRMADGRTGTLDYREKAPMGASRDMYLDSLGNEIDQLSRVGGLAVGVPGTVAGILETHNRFGTMPLEELIAPVAELARKGVVVTEKQAGRLGRTRETFIRVNGPRTKFAGTFDKGDTIKYPALARTLEGIARNGRAGFYEGPVAEAIASHVQANGGIMTVADLNAYRAVWREPVIFRYKDLEVITMGPTSSGGLTLAQIMGMLENRDVGGSGPATPETVHVMIEAFRRAYADRNHHIADPDFVDVPRAGMIDPAYLRERMAGFDPERATPSTAIQPGAPAGYESLETTHYSIVDAQGNAVAVTTTLNSGYGSKLYNDRLGFFLNNEMDDFSVKPGFPNQFGLVQGEANAIAPGKRMLSSMTPTIAVRKGKLWVVLGTPGGSFITTAVAQTLINFYEHRMSAQEAVSAPRFHHQYLPDRAMFEYDGFRKALLEALQAKGHDVLILNEGWSIGGSMDAIRVLKDGRLEGGADPRGDNAAVGY